MRPRQNDAGDGEKEPWRAGATAALRAASLVEREKPSAVGSREGNETVSGEASSETFHDGSKVTVQEQGAENGVQQADTVSKALVVDVHVQHQASDAAKS